MSRFTRNVQASLPRGKEAPGLAETLLPLDRFAQAETTHFNGCMRELCEPDVIINQVRRARSEPLGKNAPAVTRTDCLFTEVDPFTTSYIF